MYLPALYLPAAYLRAAARTLPRALPHLLALMTLLNGAAAAAPAADRGQLGYITDAGRPPRAPGAPGEGRNPFAPTPVILGRVVDGAAAVGFQRGEGSGPVPAMVLRGMVTRTGGGMAALLEIKGEGTHVVREGDTIGLYQSGANSVIRIKRIDRLTVEVEVGSMKQIIIVR